MLSRQLAAMPKHRKAFARGAGQGPSILRWDLPRPATRSAQSSGAPSNAPAVQAHGDAQHADPRRSDAPALRPYTRGTRSEAMAIAQSPAALGQAVEALQRAMHSNTSRASRSSVLVTWESVAHSAGIQEPFNLTPATVVQVVASLVQAGFRSVPTLISAAKRQHTADGYSWTPQLDLVTRDCLRAALRGVGPPNQSAAFPLDKIPDIPDSEDPWVHDGPVGPRRVLTIGCWWLLREIELSNILVSHISQPSPGEVTFTLPVSKTDPTGAGVSRSHRCVCGTYGEAPAVLPKPMCPACAVIDQLDALATRFGRPLDPNTPLCPDMTGQVVSKQDMIQTIRSGARAACLRLSTPSGAPAWGGHALRRGGVQYLGKSGVDVWRIQALARHSSNAILRYLGQSHHGHLSSIAVEAALNRDIQSVRDELSRLRAATRPGQEPTLPPSQAALDPILTLADIEGPGLSFPTSAPARPPDFETHPYVMGTRRNGKVHNRDPRRPSWTLCSWHFTAGCAFQVTASPFGASDAECAPRCAKCTQALLAPPDSSSESASAHDDA